MDPSVCPSPESDRSPLLRAVQVVLALAALGYLASYAMLALLRVRYPFELEWMEGGAVDHVRWLLAGHPLYGPPSLSFVPFIYTPFYFYLCAFVTKLLGVGLAPLRLVSIASSFGCCLLLFLLLRRETGRASLGLVGAGLFAATYPRSGAWMDLARVDSLSLVLLLLGVYLLRVTRGPASLLLAGVAFWLAYLTKQTALIVILPVVVVAFVHWRGRGVFLLVGLLLPLLVGNWLLDHTTGGWFSYYAFTLPRNHALYPPMWVGFWKEDLLPKLAPALVLGLLAVCRREPGRDRWPALLYPALALGALGAGWSSRLHVGGYLNVLLPLHATLALLAPMALDRSFAAAGSRAGAMRVVVHALCALQFALLLYRPSAYLPRAGDAAAGERLLATLAAVKGDVFVPDHGYLTARVGKPSLAHGMAIYDVERGDPGPVWQRFAQELRQAVQEQRFGAIVLDTPRYDAVLSEGNRFSPVLLAAYAKQPTVLLPSDAGWPTTGLRTRPESLYLPRQGATHP